MKGLLCLLIVIGSLGSCGAIKAVLYMHGILASYEEAKTLLGWIKDDYPGTDTLSVNMYNNAESVINMMKQVNDVAKTMKDFMNKHPEGVNLIGYSQGGLVCRGVLEQMQHNVDTFISLSSPQAGQFGDTSYLKDLFPNYLRDHVYEVAYSEIGQNISVGNYWNDPHHQDLYMKFSEFLAVINNQTYNPRSQEYKQNFLRLKKMVMIGGPDDGVITPWQSSHFGFYDEQLHVVEMKGQPWYTKDSFGLQTLDKTGRLITYIKDGVFHTHWHNTLDVYKTLIKPHLS